MKLSVAILFAGLAAVAQAMPQGVPPSATPVDGNTWRWVDKDGKAWLYRGSPFGVMRSPEPVTGVPAQGERPKGVPADAKPISGTHYWRSVDAGGKAWLYHQGPTGLLKTAETKEMVEAAKTETSKPAAGAELDAALKLMTVKEEGENLRFSKPGPFGIYTWVKKKTMLNADETLVWEHSRQARSAPQK